MIDLPDPLDGAVTWANLSPDVQSAIDAAALDLIAAWVGLDAATDDDLGTTPASRAFEAVDSLCSDRLLEVVTASVSSLDPDQPPLPASLGQVCHGCGCSERDSYDLEDRVWLPSGLCSACGPPASPVSV